MQTTPFFLLCEQQIISLTDDEALLVSVAIIRVLETQLPGEVRTAYLALADRLDQTLNQRLRSQSDMEVANGKD